MAKPKTNTQFVNDLMEFSPVGALGQVFILEALAHYSKEVMQIPDDSPEWERSFISLSAWKEQANHVLTKIENRS